MALRLVLTIMAFIVPGLFLSLLIWDTPVIRHILTCCLVLTLSLSIGGIISYLKGLQEANRMKWVIIEELNKLLNHRKFETRVSCRAFSYVRSTLLETIDKLEAGETQRKQADEMIELLSNLIAEGEKMEMSGDLDVMTMNQLIHYCRKQKRCENK